MAQEDLCRLLTAEAWVRSLVTKGNDKGHPRTGHKGPEGKQMYSSTLSLTSALDWVGGQHHFPAALPPGKEPVPIV